MATFTLTGKVLDPSGKKIPALRLEVIPGGVVRDPATGEVRAHRVRIQGADFDTTGRFSVQLVTAPGLTYTVDETSDRGLPTLGFDAPPAGTTLDLTDPKVVTALPEPGAPAWSSVLADVATLRKTVDQIATTGGVKGDAGESAYQSWLKLGHTGTEADYQEWLKGDGGEVDPAQVQSAVDTAMAATANELYTRVNAVEVDLADTAVKYVDGLPPGAAAPLGSWTQEDPEPNPITAPDFFQWRHRYKGTMRRVGWLSEHMHLRWEQWNPAETLLKFFMRPNSTANFLELFRRGDSAAGTSDTIVFSINRDGRARGPGQVRSMQSSPPAPATWLADELWLDTSTGVVRRWTGSTWQPPLPAIASGFVASAKAAGVADTISVAVPSGVKVTDTCVVAVNLAAATGTGATINTPAGFTAVHPLTNFGSGACAVFTGTGVAEGDTLTFTGANLQPSAVVAGWYRGVSSVGALAASSASRPTTTTITAPAVTDASGGDQIVTVFVEKSGGNADQLAPIVPSGLTERAWQPWSSSGVGLPSAWLGDYSAPAAAQTATYLRSSSNGRGFQIRLRY